jgi:hypothetical protein
MKKQSVTNGRAESGRAEERGPRRGCTLGLAQPATAGCSKNKRPQGPLQADKMAENGPTRGPCWEDPDFPAPLDTVLTVGEKLLDVPAKLHLVVAMARVTVYHALITDYVSYY